MVPPFPPEILDLIVNYLRNKPKTLKACCLVSKPWIRPTRKHLFAVIKFHAYDTHAKQRGKTFPDLANSPAHHTRTLYIHLPDFFEDAGVDVLRTFCGVIHLNVSTRLRYWSDRTSLVPLYGLSPAIRSLRLRSPHLENSEVFGLICSLPLLEDLTLALLGFDHRGGRWSTPSTSPRLSGSLEMWMFHRTRSTVLRLLELPNGLHFTKITVHCRSEEGIDLAMSLVSRCSDTLESLDVENGRGSDEFLVTPFNLSKATKLRDLTLRCGDPAVRWITRALHTVEPKNLQQITLELPDGAAIREMNWETVRLEWLGLDRSLVLLSASHTLRLKIMHGFGMGREDMKGHITRFLPGLAERGIDDMVEFIPYNKIWGDEVDIEARYRRVFAKDGVSPILIIVFLNSWRETFRFPESSPAGERNGERSQRRQSMKPSSQAIDNRPHQPHQK